MRPKGKGAFPIAGLHFRDEGVATQDGAENANLHPPKVSPEYPQDPGNPPDQQKSKTYRREIEIAIRFQNSDGNDVQHWQEGDRKPEQTEK